MCNTKQYSINAFLTRLSKEISLLMWTKQYLYVHPLCNDRHRPTTNNALDSPKHDRYYQIMCKISNSESWEFEKNSFQEFKKNRIIYSKNPKTWINLESLSWEFKMNSLMNSECILSGISKIILLEFTINSFLHEYKKTRKNYSEKIPNLNSFGIPLCRNSNWILHEF